MITDAQKWLVLATLLLSGWLLYLLGPVLTPFAIAALIAYLADPVVDKLEARKCSRTVSVCIVFGVMGLALILVLLFIIPILEQQFFNLLQRIPDMIDWLEQSLLPRITELLQIESKESGLEKLKLSLSENWRDVGGIMAKVLGHITHSGQTLMTMIATILLVPVVSFYLLRDWDILIERIHELIPLAYEKTIVKISKECDQVLGEFMHGQLLVMLAQGILYSIGLWIVGLEFALLIGMLAGLVSFVPYLGFIIGIVVAGITAFMQYQDVIHLVYVLIVFGIGQAIEGMLLSPLLVGDKIGLHPVAVIFAVMAGGQLFGFIGVLLALPVAAIIVVLLRYVHDQYMDSNLYSA